MEIYQRLGDALTLKEVDTLWHEVIDRFGIAPEPAIWLYHLSRIRVFAAQRGYTHVRLESASLTYERKKGNSVTTNRVLLPRTKSPQDLETRIFSILNDASY